MFWPVYHRSCSWHHWMHLYRVTSLHSPANHPSCERKWYQCWSCPEAYLPVWGEMKNTEELLLVVLWTLKINHFISAPVAELESILVEQPKRNDKLLPNEDQVTFICRADAQQLFMRTHPMTVPLTCWLWKNTTLKLWSSAIPITFDKCHLWRKQAYKSASRGYNNNTKAFKSDMQALPSGSP